MAEAGPESGAESGAELLRDHTTLRLGGPASSFVTATTEDELVDAVASADAAGEPVLVLGGGSNLVVADAGFAGTVVRVATTGVTADTDGADSADGPDENAPTESLSGHLGCLGAVTVTAAAGEDWDAFVARAVASGWVGVEALSGIPGSVGATPIQNVGAYGQEVAQTIASVRTWDRQQRARRTFAAADCGFGYRTSRFKQQPGRYLVLEVTFLLRQGTLGRPVEYAELAGALGVERGGRVPMGEVRDAVLGLRRGKAMVLDADDHDTWSAGSFFTNPVIAPGDVPTGAPAWPQPDGTVKTSAAWLIEHAGFGKGYGDGTAQVSGRHSLALTNRGNASTAELLALAREIRAGVEERYGIRLVNEPVLVGCSL